MKLELVGQHDAVAKRQQDVFDSRIFLYAIVQCRNDARVFVGGLKYPAISEHIIEYDQTALTYEIHAPVVIIIIAGLVGIDEAKVKRPGDRFQRFRGRPFLDLDLLDVGTLRKEALSNSDRVRIDLTGNNLAVRRQ